MALSIDETYSHHDCVELELLINTMKLSFGKDFSQYSRSSLMRRVVRRKQLWQLSNISEMIPLIIKNPMNWQTLLNDLSTSVTEFFRDPFVYQSLKEEVFPILATYPFFKVWVAGCASGEEVYSLAILLHEHGLLNRARIYGTDFNDNVLKIAKDGIYNQDKIERSRPAYKDAGGSLHLDDYFHFAYGKGRIKPLFKGAITYANHNLTSDGVFGEIELISCRNVLIYFDKNLKQRALNLFNDSLHPGGFLTIGTHETLYFKEHVQAFDSVNEKASIYRKRCPENVEI